MPSDGVTSCRVSAQGLRPVGRRTAPDCPTPGWRFGAEQPTQSGRNAAPTRTAWFGRYRSGCFGPFAHRSGRSCPQDHMVPFLITIDETFDIGLDTRTPVDDRDYQVPFAFNGKIAQVRCKLGPVQLTENDRRVMHASLVRAKDQGASRAGAPCGTPIAGSAASRDNVVCCTRSPSKCRWWGRRTNSGVRRRWVVGTPGPNPAIHPRWCRG